MKKETNKKSKLWLWILIAVLGLAIIGGVVAAFVLPGLFQQQGPTGPVAEAKLYWNLDRNLWLEEETNMSARETAEDGYFHIRYAFDGKVEELKITDDKRLVNYLDSQDVICLAFDENGIVVDCAPASTYFTPAAKDLYTKRVQGNMLQLNSSMAMNGMDMEFDISNIPVYEVAEGSEEKGTLVTPKWLDVVTIYNDLEGNPYAAYVTGHLAINAEVGWRVESDMYSASAGYKRTPDKDGVYTIPFAINGEIVNRYIKDYDMAISIERQSMYTAYFALEFDEEGYIIDYENPAMAMQGVQLCAAFNVDSVQDGFVTATRYMSGNNQGETVQFTYDETCEIYQCCVGGCYEKHCGERIDSLQEGDLISVFTDLDGKAVLIYVAIRTVDSPAYYNLVQSYSYGEKKSTRVPNEDGYYVFDMAVNGGVKTLRTKNKEIVELIDANSNRVLGLKLSGSVIKEYYGIQCVSGRGIAFGGRFVTSYNRPVVSIAATSDITNVANWIISDDCKIYTVNENFGVKKGTKTDIKVGDQVLGTQNARGELNYIYVQQSHKAGYKIGYNMGRKYSTATNATTRIPDEEGYYVYDVAYNGSVVQYKTKNKAMADFIDLQNAPVFGFKEKNGIFTDVCTAASAISYGTKAYNYNYIENMNGGILTSWYMSNGVKTLGTAQWNITSKTKTYNVSKGYEDHPGEKSKPKVGDKIQALVNAATREIEYIFIMNRSVDSPIYWMVSRVAPKYVNGVLTGSNRVPDEDGYYVFDLLNDGKIKQFKTKDEMIAAEVDTYTQGLGLKLKKGTNIIERVVGIADTKYPNTAISNQDVKKISGSTLTTERCRLTSYNYGEKLTLTIGKNVKIYDVSSYAKNWGAPAKLKVGDRIVAYSDLEGKLAYIFITKAAAREKGSWGYCEHCGKTVFWDSYSENFAADGHYYLPADTERTGAIVFGSTTDDAVYDQVFDLNGHTLKCTTNAFTVIDKLTIIDSVGTGKISNSKGLSYNGQKQGGNVFVRDGGTFTLLSGTIENGAVGLTGVGSNISAYNGTVNIKGGKISGGVGYLGTAVYHGGTEGGINISGGKLAGSVFAEESNKITLSGAPTIEKLIVPAGNKIKLGNLKNGASITVKGDGIFTNEYANINTLKGYFKVANSKDTITVSGKALKYNNLSGELVVPEPESPNKPLVLDKNGMGQCILCGDKVQWTALREGDIIGDMNPVHPEFNAELFGGDQHQFHYYVAEDMTAGDGDFLYGWQGNSVCLHLNGKTLNVRGGFYGGNGSTINIYGEGKVHYLSNSTTSYTAGNMFEAYTSNINLYGGEYTSATNMIHGAGSALQLSISDDAIINGNVKLDYGNATISGNIFVKRIAIGETAKLSITRFFKGSATLSVAAPLEEGNLIPEANAEVLGKYTGKLTYADFRQIVYKDGRLKVVGEAPSPNDTLKLDANNRGICNVCFEEVQWIPLRAGDRIGDVHSDGQSVHYYVAEDMTAGEGDFQFIRDKSENVAAKATATVCLHLNGKLLNVKGVIEGGHGAHVNIMGDGKITNGGAKELFQLYTANLTLYGGEYFGCGYPVFNSLGEAAKLTVMGDAKLYGDAKLPYGAMILKENGRVDNVALGNAVVQKDTNGDGTPDDVTVYGKVTVGANWAGMAKLTVDAGNMDGKTIKAESGIAQGDFTGVLINQDNKKFVNSDGMLQLTNKKGSIPAAPAAPKAPAVPTAPLPEGINDNLVLDSEGKALCVHCGEEVYWNAIENGDVIGNIPGSGSNLHFYLAEDVTSYGTFIKNQAGNGFDTICLHLNGHNLTTEGGFVLQNNSKFNLMGNGNVNLSKSGLLFEIWTCAVNIYGGNFTSDKVMDSASSNSKVAVYGDVNFNGLVSIKAGYNYFAHNVSATKVDVSGTGKLQLANNWNGTLEISVADSMMDGNFVKSSVVDLIGEVDGTITHAEGVVKVVDGRLQITMPEPETPVWGNFNPDACDGKAYCEACGEAAGVFDWIKISSAPGYFDNTNGGLTHKHYYLANDYNHNNSAQFIGLNRIGACLHLNGHKLTSSSRLFITAADANTVFNIIAGENGGIDYTAATTSHQGCIVNANASLNIIGGTYTSTQTTGEIKPMLQSKGPATLTDAVVNGITDLWSTMTVKGSTSLTNLQFNGSGKLVIDAGWSGNITMTIAPSDIIGNMISSSRAVVNGDFTGTITLADGRTAVKEGNQLKVEGNLPDINDDLVLDADNKGMCLHCGEEVTWTPIANGQSIGTVETTGASLHYYLTEDNTSNGKFFTSTNADQTGSDTICLHLNGHDLNTKDGFVLQNGNTFNLMGNGTVTHTGSGKWMFEIWTCNVNIYGGKFVPSATTEAGIPSVLSMRSANAKVNISKNATFECVVEVLNGKLTVAEGWTGSLKLSVPEADITNNLINTARVEVKGDLVGTITMADGRAVTKEGNQLKIGEAVNPPAPPATSEPVWGVFEPWKYGGRAYCEACGKAAGIKTWQVYDGANYKEASGITLSDPNGVVHYHFYIDKDVEFETENYLISYENICFNLNGHNITAKGATSTYPIRTTQRLCMMGEGIVTGGKPSSTSFGSVFHINGGNASSSLYIYGGTYKLPEGCNSPLLLVGTNGGRVFINGGTLDVPGAEAIYANGNLNTTEYYSSVTVNGGIINGNVNIGNKDNAETRRGMASLTLNGGTVNGTITASAEAPITLGGATTATGISISANSKLTVKANFTGKAAVSFAAALVDNVVPAANGAAEGAFAGFLSLTDGRALVADGTSLKVPANANLLKNLVFAEGTKTAVCPLCGGEPVQWTEVSGRIGYKNDGKHHHFYLSSDLVAVDTAQFAEFESNTTVCFHLNGHNLTTSSRFIVSSGTANILGRGNVLFEGDCYNTSQAQTTLDGYNSVGFEVSKNGTLNVYGGNYATAGAALKGSKPMMKASTATSKLNLFDVSVAGGVQAVAGNTTLDASALIDQISVTNNGKLNVAGTFTGTAAVNFATGLVDDAVPTANGASTGAFTGKLTLLDGTVLIGSDGKLVKQPVNS